MGLGKIPESFEGFRDLIFREQFLAVPSNNKVRCLNERKIKSVQELIDLSD